MNQSDISKATKSTLTQEIATRTSDPMFYSALNFLPNPDDVLRKLGKGQEVFEAIGYDPHVVGELRATRSGLLSYESRINAGGDNANDLRARDLCQLVLDRKPTPGMSWSDVTWNKGKAIFNGFAVHEIQWKNDGGFLLPFKIQDKPNRRFVFSTDNELRLLTRNNMMDGDQLGDKKWLLTRHMPSYDNPYGMALFSACLWPYIFKHNGFKFFSKFCERFGIPWIAGKVPVGTSVDDKNNFADFLAEMMASGVFVIPDDGSIELVEAKSSGDLPQERIIQLCNAEMSKALTSQTLATEISGNGSRAAAETHREREKSGNESDREVIAESYNQLFSWITELNFNGAKPPTFEFYEEAEVRQDRVDMLKAANEIMDIPASFAYEQFGIPIPQNGEPVLTKVAPSLPSSTVPQNDFNACPNCGETHDFNAHDDALNALTEKAADGADKIIESMAKPIQQLLIDFEKDGKSMADFQTALVTMYPAIDTDALAEHTRDVMMLGLLQGMDDV